MLSEAFVGLEDPRHEKSQKHLLKDIIAISVCAFICGADGWAQVELFGKSKKSWFESFLELPNGIPSHDTFGRFYASLDPKSFAQSFQQWIKEIHVKTEGEIIPIDGKTLRRSYDKKSNKSAIHMVSAWSAQNRIVLGQIKTDEKSNEITAIPELLEVLDVRGCIVTIDAMGCQKDIVERINQKGGDYVIALKGNQGKLFDDAKMFWEIHNETSFTEIACDYFATEDKCHGRKEIRRYWHSDALNWLSQKSDWSGLKTLGMVESERTVNDKTSLEYRYYISSLPMNAEKFGDAVRKHWSIENSLHWVLDIAFREDESRIRSKNSAENTAILRHIVLNALKMETSQKCGIKSKRLNAGWDHDYLAKIYGLLISQNIMR